MFQIWGETLVYIKIHISSQSRSAHLSFVFCVNGHILTWCSVVTGDHSLIIDKYVEASLSILSEFLKNARLSAIGIAIIFAFNNHRLKDWTNAYYFVTFKGEMGGSSQEMLSFFVLVKYMLHTHTHTHTHTHAQHIQTHPQFRFLDATPTDPELQIRKRLQFVQDQTVVV